MGNYHKKRKILCWGSRIFTAGMDDDNLHLTTTFIYTGCYHLIREWLIRDIQKTPKEISDLLLRIVSKELL